MIRVTIEMIPLGIGKPRHLGTIEIANDASGTSNTGNYDAALSRRDKPARAWRRVRVEGFPRLRLGAYDLLYRVLHAAVSARNKRSTSR